MNFNPAFSVASFTTQFERPWLNNIEHVASEIDVASPLTRLGSVCLKVEYVLSENDNALVAPWWTDIIIQRVASSDGSPLPRALVDEYERLVSQIGELASDGDVEAGAVSTAQRLLWRAMFAGAVAPYISWHSDSVVLFWSAGAKRSFFTIESDSFSYLEECDGVITERQDDFQPQVWESIFPLTYGIH